MCILIIIRILFRFFNEEYYKTDDSLSEHYNLWISFLFFMIGPIKKHLPPNQFLLLSSDFPLPLRELGLKCTFFIS